MLQVDFANKSIGGGVLRWGCVQEEIRFVLSPELIVSRLFVQELAANEVVIITGSERFSSYKGYADTFAWAGDFVDNTPFDSKNRRQTQIVAMDAIQLSGSANSQFSIDNVERELNKAYCGFYSSSGNKLSPVASGHWGCGVFNGSKDLKSIIQWAASTVAGRPLVYFTFADDLFAEAMKAIIDIFKEKNVTVGDALKAVQEYAALLEDSKSNLLLFAYLEARFS